MCVCVCVYLCAACLFFLCRPTSVPTWRINMFVKAAAAGCGLTFPPSHPDVSSGHGIRDRVYGSDTSGHGVSRRCCYRAQK